MLQLKKNLQGVVWKDLTHLYKITDLGERTILQLQHAFANSTHVAFVYDKEQVVAAGRAISDGVYYAGVFDIAVLPEYQGCGVGRRIMDTLIKDLEGQFIMLTTTVGKEPFYQKLGFRKHKTAMAIYPQHKQQSAKIYLEDD